MCDCAKRDWSDIPFTCDEMLVYRLLVIISQRVSGVQTRFMLNFKRIPVNKAVSMQAIQY